MMSDQHQIMLEKIRRGAVRAFGEDAGDRWLNRTWRVFDDRTPLEMATRPGGGERVLEYVSYLTAAEDALRRAAVAESEH